MSTPPFKKALRSSLSEIQSNQKAIVKTSGEPKSRCASVAWDVAKRDVEVIAKALKIVDERFRGLSEILYYGSTAREVHSQKTSSWSSFRGCRHLGIFQRPMMSARHSGWDSCLSHQLQGSSKYDEYDLGEMVDAVRQQTVYWRSRNPGD